MLRQFVHSSNVPHALARVPEDSFGAVRQRAVILAAVGHGVWPVTGQMLVATDTLALQRQPVHRIVSFEVAQTRMSPVSAGSTGGDRGRCAERQAGGVGVDAGGTPGGAGDPEGPDG